MAAGAPSNAFAVLMGTQRKRTCVSGAVFVPCPAECGKHMLQRDVNAHLDSCIRRGTLSEHSREASSGQPPSQRESNVDSRGKLLQQFKDPPSKFRRVSCPACDKSFPKSLINLHYQERLRAIYVHFSPARFGDELTDDQVLQNFPELIPL